MTETAEGVWMLVEIMGHRRHYGLVREHEQFGTKMLRVDIPIDGDPEKGWNTHFYGGPSIYGLTVVTKEMACTANKPRREITAYRLTGPSDVIEFGVGEQYEDDDGARDPEMTDSQREEARVRAIADRAEARSARVRAREDGYDDGVPF